MMDLQEVALGMFCISWGRRLCGFCTVEPDPCCMLEAQGDECRATQLTYPIALGARADCSFADRLKRTLPVRLPTTNSYTRGSSKLGQAFLKTWRMDGGWPWRIRRFMLTDALHHTSMPSHRFENTYIPEPPLV